MSSAPSARRPRRAVHMAVAVVLWVGWLVYVGHGLVTHSHLDATQVGVGVVLAAAWTWIWWNGGVRADVAERGTHFPGIRIVRQQDPRSGGASGGDRGVVTFDGTFLDDRW